MTGFYASSNDAFAREYSGVSWDELFPSPAASQVVYKGQESELEKLEMCRLMIRVLWGLTFLGLCERSFFSCISVKVA